MKRAAQLIGFVASMVWLVAFAADWVNPPPWAAMPLWLLAIAVVVTFPTKES